MKERLAKMNQIEFIEKARVYEFISEGNTILGVKIRRKGGELEDIVGDFVADISGRRSDILKRLEKVGISVPSETFDPKLIYMACELKKTKEIGEETFLSFLFSHDLCRYSCRKISVYS